MGGGNFASVILLNNSGNFFLTLVGMLLRVVPFFLIPGLVKGSLSALGNLGAKIGNIGNRLGGTAAGALRRSDGFQRFQEFGEQARGRGIQLRHKVLSTLSKKPLGEVGTRGSRRRLARAVSAQEARVRGDARAGAVASGGFLTRGQRKDIMASALESEEEQGINDAMNGFKLDDQFDHNNSGVVKNKLQEQLNELLKHPENIEARRKVKALTKILLETDDGRGALTEAAQQFASANRDSSATRILGTYLSRSENMSVIKGHNQRGLQALAQHMSGGARIQSLASYNAMGADKIGAGAVGGLDESFLKAQVAAAQSGAMSQSDLQKLANTYTRALTSENAANEIQPELVKYLNDIRQLASPGASYLNPGDMLPIPHATMPVGWRYDNAAQQWVDGRGAALSREDAIKAEEILKHNANVDINNP